MKHLLLLLSALWILQACSTPGDEVSEIDADYIGQVIDTLSSDYFLGRKPCTIGEKRTLSYLQKQFEDIGIEPGNGTSYLQEVPLVEVNGQSDSIMRFKSPSKTIDLKLGTEFVSYTQQEVKEVKVEDSEVIFCGFGISAPESNWDDFAGVDIKGKTIIVLVNDPGFGSDDPNHFKGNTMTYYGRWTYKYEEAARQGAAAVLIVHETTSAGYPWYVVSNSWSGSKLNLGSKDGNKELAAVQGWITLEAAKKLFEEAGHDLAQSIRNARTKEFQPFSLGYSMSHGLRNKFAYDKSQNVIAKIEGTERPEEYIIYTAHWDHLGIGKPVDGDSIYNGAVDNGTGVACVLSIAKAMAQGPRPERSVVFLLVTAEEQGLLGSQYYAEHPLYPPSKTVANLNMDGMKTYGAMKYLTLTGMGHSELDQYAEDAAKKQDRSVVANPEPEKGYFFRSDHFNFAKIGIPALYAEGDIEHAEKGREYVERQKEKYLQERYHQPADEFDPATWDLAGLKQDAELYLDIGLRLANEKTWPAWYASSEFKAARDASKK